jgi:Leucine-rich repeat (LRR) protein
LRELDCSDNKLTGLDLSNCPQLTVLRCSRNQLTKLDLQKNTKLEIVDVSQNKISANLDIFTQLKNLKELFLGSSSVTLGRTENDFTGRLDSLKVNRELKIVAIGQQRNIKGNLTSLLYLMSGKLEYFYCQGTEYQNILEPQEYKVKE